uniref:Uncharacterized protein n=1 Tax=Arundo donax TaxID=35708 RepID=A0A0A9CK48_ARUDO
MNIILWMQPSGFQHLYLVKKRLLCSCIELLSLCYVRVKLSTMSYVIKNQPPCTVRVWQAKLYSFTSCEYVT